MKYMTARQAAKKWGVNVRRVQAYCAEGRVKGAERVGTMWLLPEGAEKPVRQSRGGDVVQRGKEK